MTIIVADTLCGLPRELLERQGIPFVPQVVVFGEQSFHEVLELDTPTFLQKLKASPVLPKSAAPEPPLYHAILQCAREQKEAVVVVAPSAKVSGTVRSAEVAAADFPDLDIRIVDTQTISCNLGSLVLLAQSMAKAGKPADEIVAKLNEMIPRGRLYFVVDTLEYLAKGGRIGGAKALVGELLQIKPVLTIKDGQVESFEQQRTRKRSVARLAEIVETQCPKSPEAYLSVLQVAAEDEARGLAADLKARMNLPEVPIYELPPVIAVHSGPGAVGVGFFAAGASPGP